MFKKISVVLLCLGMPLTAMAGDSESLFGLSHDSQTLKLSVRRIGLDWSKTQVRNAAQYQDSPVSALNATSQDYIKGVFDTILEFTKNKFKWDNSLIMEYGKTTLKPYNAPATTDENADKILYSSDLSYSCWEFAGLKFGPTVRAAYETQFADSQDSPRQNIVRSSAGISLFDHDIIKSLYLTGIHEYDFTYAGDQNNKIGAEFGWRLEYAIRDGVKVSSDGYYREYFSYSGYVSTDLERDLSAVLRLDTNLWGHFTMGPYVQYRLAKARGADVYGSNLIVGISFNYITDFLF
ncbi:MAG: DUF3078 domain-containing protein [Proteobacteria bacterium]|uniref:DUF3078 domain-containing protein n=1 Tax=Candidatus Enterousia excrementavium TaxID=2840789 RepID=A0A940DEY3_9PROT|nr:DUF3078 domain-containing protein [Candidatus Enterousia excrementavium]